MPKNIRDPIILNPAAGTAEDITEVRRQVVLLKTKVLQEAIFTSANFSIIATDAKGGIQVFNVGAKRRTRNPDCAGLRGFGIQGLAQHRGCLRIDLYPQGWLPFPGSRVGHRAARRSGYHLGYLLIGSDNTARKQIEAEQKLLDQRLRDQQFYTRLLIESNIDAIMITDPSGIITDVNKQMEAHTGCTRDELIGAPFNNYFTDPERAEASIKQVLSKKKVTHYELTP